MPTWQQLRDAKFAVYEDAAHGWGKVGSRAYAARVRVDQEMAAPIHTTQKGDAQTAATTALTRLNRNYQYLHGECESIRATLNGLAAEMTGAQNKLRSALQDAEDLGLTVNGDGSVTYPRTEEPPPSPGSATTLRRTSSPTPPARATPKRGRRCSTTSSTASRPPKAVRTPATPL